MRLAELGEFGFLEKIWSRLGAGVPGAILGSGDDAAVLLCGEGQYLLLSTDAVVEGRHFRWEWLSAAEIGERAARAALSDLAAMGGRAKGVLASAALPAAMDAEEAEALLEGVDAAARASGARLLGGDLVGSPGPVFLDLVAVGETREYWPRSGAQVGDAVLVSGRLGASAAALARLLEGTAVADLPAAWRERFVRPEPAFDVVAALGTLGVVTAAIDISDGLLGDLAHVAKASGVEIAVDANQVPLAEGIPAVELALRSGEEYELAFTVPREAVETAVEAAESAGARRLTVIGEVRTGSGVVVAGEVGDGPRGFDQFSAGFRRARRE